MAIAQVEVVQRPKKGLLPSGAFARLGDGPLLARFTAIRDEVAEIAFAALVRRHGPMVLRVCQQVLGDRHTAEDVFQATFLILARKAGSIHQPELLGHWLYGVALRTAREARMRESRRRRHELPCADGLEREPIDETERPDRTIFRREEYEALHEEVSRLPERYRIAVVLCDLQGLTYREAAHRLRCPVGTIGVRLQRARERLRARLTRRGLASMAGLTSALFAVQAGTPRVPPLLVDASVRAAIPFAAGSALTTAIVSDTVATLTEKVLGTIAAARLKLAVQALFAIGITAAVGWLGAHRGSHERQESARLKADAPLAWNQIAPPLGERHAVAPETPAPAAQPVISARVATRAQCRDCAVRRDWCHVSRPTRGDSQRSEHGTGTGCGQRACRDGPSNDGHRAAKR